MSFLLICKTARSTKKHSKEFHFLRVYLVSVWPKSMNPAHDNVIQEVLFAALNRLDAILVDKIYSKLVFEHFPGFLEITTQVLTHYQYRFRTDLGHAHRISCPRPRKRFMAFRVPTFGARNAMFTDCSRKRLILKPCEVLD